MFHETKTLNELQSWEATIERAKKRNDLENTSLHRWDQLKVARQAMFDHALKMTQDNYYKRVKAMRDPSVLNAEVGSRARFAVPPVPNATSYRLILPGGRQSAEQKTIFFNIPVTSTSQAGTYTYEYYDGKAWTFGGGNLTINVAFRCSNCDKPVASVNSGECRCHAFPVDPPLARLKLPPTIIQLAGSLVTLVNDWGPAIHKILSEGTLSPLIMAEIPVFNLQEKFVFTFVDIDQQLISAEQITALVEFLQNVRYEVRRILYTIPSQVNLFPHDFSLPFDVQPFAFNSKNGFTRDHHRRMWYALLRGRQIDATLVAAIHLLHSLPIEEFTSLEELATRFRIRLLKGDQNDSSLIAEEVLKSLGLRSPNVSEAVFIPSLRRVATGGLVSTDSPLKPLYSIHTPYALFEDSEWQLQIVTLRKSIRAGFGFNGDSGKWNCCGRKFKDAGCRFFSQHRNSLEHQYDLIDRYDPQVPVNPQMTQSYDLTRSNLVGLLKGAYMTGETKLCDGIVLAANMHLCFNYPWDVSQIKPHPIGFRVEDSVAWRNAQPPADLPVDVKKNQERYAAAKKTAAAAEAKKQVDAATALAKKASDEAADAAALAAKLALNVLAAEQQAQILADEEKKRVKEQADKKAIADAKTPAVKTEDEKKQEAKEKTEAEAKAAKFAADALAAAKQLEILRAAAKAADEAATLAAEEKKRKDEKKAAANKKQREDEAKVALAVAAAKKAEQEEKQRVEAEVEAERKLNAVDVKKEISGVFSAAEQKLRGGLAGFELNLKQVGAANTFTKLKEVLTNASTTFYDKDPLKKTHPKDLKGLYTFLQTAIRDNSTADNNWIRFGQLLASPSPFILPISPDIGKLLEAHFANIIPQIPKGKSWDADDLRILTSSSFKGENINDQVSSALDDLHNDNFIGIDPIRTLLVRELATDIIWYRRSSAVGRFGFFVRGKTQALFPPTKREEKNPQQYAIMLSGILTNLTKMANDREHVSDFSAALKSFAELLLQAALFYACAETWNAKKEDSKVLQLSIPKGIADLKIESMPENLFSAPNWLIGQVDVGLASIMKGNQLPEAQRTLMLLDLHKLFVLCCISDQHPFWTNVQYKSQLPISLRTDEAFALYHNE